MTGGAILLKNTHRLYLHSYSLVYCGLPLRRFVRGRLTGNSAGQLDNSLEIFWDKRNRILPLSKCLSIMCLYDSRLYIRATILMALRTTEH